MPVGVSPPRQTRTSNPWPGLNSPVHLHLNSVGPYIGSSGLGLSKTNWPADKGVGEAVGLLVGGRGVEVRVAVRVEVGEGLATGVVVSVWVAPGDGAGVTLAVGVLVEVGVRLGSGFCWTVEVLVGVPVKVDVAVGREVGVEVAVEEGLAPGNGAGALVAVGVCISRLSRPDAGVSLSKAWAVAIRICVALSLLLASVIERATTTTITIADRP